MRKTLTLLLALPAILAPSCGPKDICFDHVHIYDALLAFDWTLDPDASPSAMTAWYYPADNEEIEELQFSFTGRNGGRVRMPYGEYSAVALNGDLGFWARLRGKARIETLELLTADATALPISLLDAAGLPVADEAKGQRLAQAPEMVWADRGDGFMHEKMETPKTLTLRPRRAVAVFSVTVTGIEGFENLRLRGLDATISGLAEGFLPGSHTPTSEPVAMPCELLAAEGRELRGELMAFGAAASEPAPNILTVYMQGEDGSAAWQAFDVTDQVRASSDPLRVDIRVSGLKIPKPTITDGEMGAGFGAAVTEWNEIDKTIKM